MSYISGRGGVTSADATGQRDDQQEQYGPGRTAADGDGRSFVPDLYPRRPLGQRLTDRLLVGLLFLPLLAAVLLSRQAVTR